MKTPSRSPSTSRHGVTVIYALVVLAIIGVMLSECARNIITIRRMLDTRQHQLQSSWLARSGVELAIARLVEADDYQGETANLMPDARVSVSIAPIAGTTDRFRITCEAKYPVDRPGVVTTKLERDVQRVQNGNVTRIAFVADGDG